MLLRNNEWVRAWYCEYSMSTLHTRELLLTRGIDSHTLSTQWVHIIHTRVITHSRFNYSSRAPCLRITFRIRRLKVWSHRRRMRRRELPNTTSLVVLMEFSTAFSTSKKCFARVFAIISHEQTLQTCAHKPKSKSLQICVILLFSDQVGLAKTKHARGRRGGTLRGDDMPK